MSRLVDLQYRMLERLRPPQAFEAARTPGTAGDLDGLRGARQCLIVTFKRSDEPVPTVVNFGIAGGRLYFRSEPRSGKVRRIENDPHVRVCPCSFRGRPSGPAVEGRARVLSESESRAADAALEGNWTGPMKAMERGLDRLPIEMAYVEVEPAAAAGDKSKEAS
jgi:PPOX class probable F420-dependent enzyme